jgi:hypothetical protein
MRVTAKGRRLREAPGWSGMSTDELLAHEGPAEIAARPDAGTLVDTNVLIDGLRAVVVHAGLARMSTADRHAVGRGSSATPSSATTPWPGGSTRRTARVDPPASGAGGNIDPPTRPFYGRVDGSNNRGWNMQFGFIYRVRDNITESAEKRTLQLFTNWEPPFTFLHHWAFADGGGGFGVVETDSPAALMEGIAPWIAYFSFELMPVLEIEQAVPIFAKVIEWRDSVA